MDGDGDGDKDKGGKLLKSKQRMRDATPFKSIDSSDGDDDEEEEEEEEADDDDDDFDDDGEEEVEMRQEEQEEMGEFLRLMFGSHGHLDGGVDDSCNDCGQFHPRNSATELFFNPIQEVMRRRLMLEVFGAVAAGREGGVPLARSGRTTSTTTTLPASASSDSAHPFFVFGMDRPPPRRGSAATSSHFSDVKRRKQAEAKRQEAENIITLPHTATTGSASSFGSDRRRPNPFRPISTSFPNTTTTTAAAAAASAANLKRKLPDAVDLGFEDNDYDRYGLGGPRVGYGEGGGLLGSASTAVHGRRLSSQQERWRFRNFDSFHGEDEVKNKDEALSDENDFMPPLMPRRFRRPLDSFDKYPPAKENQRDFRTRHQHDCGSDSDSIDDEEEDHDQEFCVDCQLSAQRREVENLRDEIANQERDLKVVKKRRLTDGLAAAAIGGVAGVLGFIGTLVIEQIVAASASSTS